MKYAITRVLLAALFACFAAVSNAADKPKISN